MVKVDFQSLHYFLVLEFLEFGLELFPVFVHFRVHVVYIPLFEHQQVMGVNVICIQNVQ